MRVDSRRTFNLSNQLGRFVLKLNTCVLFPLKGKNKEREINIQTFTHFHAHWDLLCLVLCFDLYVFTSSCYVQRLLFLMRPSKTLVSVMTPNNISEWKYSINISSFKESFSKCQYSSVDLFDDHSLVDGISTIIKRNIFFLSKVNLYSVSSWNKHSWRTF